jgi:hypothetical protein
MSGKVSKSHWNVTTTKTDVDRMAALACGVLYYGIVRRAARRVTDRDVTTLTSHHNLTQAP